MIKINIKTPKLPDLRKFRDELINKRFIQELGMYTLDLIFKRVKSGWGVDSDDKDPEYTNRQRLSPLSDGYKKQRKGLIEFRAKNKKGGEVIVKFKIKKPLLGKFATPNKSNLTFTGEMLDSIEIKAGDKGFNLYINNKRRSDGMTNKNLAELVTEEGRPFFAITKQEIRMIRTKINQRATALIKKYFG